jgi:hypothetical protein
MNRPYEKSVAEPKQRYRLVTLYLWFIPVGGILSLVNPACVVALLCWKKWGFWGLSGQAVFVALIDFYRHASLEAAFVPAFGCVILYLILQAGEAKRAWPQLD